MPRYHFHVRTMVGLIRDVEGTECVDEDSARENAHAVVRELMQHREARVRSWVMEVTDGAMGRCFDVLFATVDDGLDKLPPVLAATVLSASANSAALARAAADVRNSIYDLKATLARYDGRAHVVAVDGYVCGRDARHHRSGVDVSIERNSAISEPPRRSEGYCRSDYSARHSDAPSR